MFKHTLVTMALAAPLMGSNPVFRGQGFAGVYISSQDIENFTRKGEKVGEYEPLEVEQFAEPANICIVDKEASLLKQIKQCKKQRLGWLKI